MKKLMLLMLLAFSSVSYGQKIKDYLPSLICTFLAGSSDGLRDASMYRMDGYGKFWNGKNSWSNKYKNNDMRQGPAYFGSTSFLAFTTDGPHLSNMVTHQFNGMAVAFMPSDENKKFGHVVLKVLAYNAVRQAGHSLVYGLIFKPKYPGDNPLPY
ncbi:hypothetical protein [Segetibacter sp.]|jgi:hypothetical protein|uniref:hypothetical protein n=1 Tax=Segetibacter sp. TaxID=2231182 RepID=UPI00262E804E|nr:hypothetical protein [Segetibacter sp.]